MIVKDLRPAGRHTSLLVLARGDSALMVRSILYWLRSRFVSGAVCVCISACLLLHYCSVCQVRDVKGQIYAEQRNRLELSLPCTHTVYMSSPMSHLFRKMTQRQIISSNKFGYSNVIQCDIYTVYI